jgi:hypothetical protein
MNKPMGYWTEDRRRWNQQKIEIQAVWYKLLYGAEDFDMKCKKRLCMQIIVTLCWVLLYYFIQSVFADMVREYESE